MQFSSRDFSQKKGGNGANNATYLFLLLLLLPFPKNGNGEKHAGVFFSYFFHSWVYIRTGKTGEVIGSPAAPPHPQHHMKKVMNTDRSQQRKRDFARISFPSFRSDRSGRIVCSVTPKIFRPTFFKGKKNFRVFPFKGKTLLPRFPSVSEHHISTFRGEQFVLFPPAPLPGAP